MLQTCEDHADERKALQQSNERHGVLRRLSTIYEFWNGMENPQKSKVMPLEEKDDHCTTQSSNPNIHRIIHGR